MTTIPKALVHVTTSFAVEPTEEQLLEYYKDFGYETIEDILNGHSGGDWGEVIREWFVNSYFNPDDNDVLRTKNILRYESDIEQEEVDIINEQEWNELKENDLIY